MGVTPFDQIACRKALLELRYEGPMTPPSERGTLLYPGPGGGMNWGSVAVDERRQLMVVNNMHLPFVIHMIQESKIPLLAAGALPKATVSADNSAAHPFPHA